jgi:hypothetical protein
MRWSEMERVQPRLAGLGRRRLLDPGVVLVATIRRNGTPRISPVEPYVMGGTRSPGSFTCMTSASAM